MIHNEANLRSNLAFKRSSFLKTSLKTNATVPSVEVAAISEKKVGYNQNQVQVKSVRFNSPDDYFLILREKFDKSHSDLRLRFSSSFDEHDNVNEISE